MTSLLWDVVSRGMGYGGEGGGGTPSSSSATSSTPATRTEYSTSGSTGGGTGNIFQTPRLDNTNNNNNNNKDSSWSSSSSSYFDSSSYLKYANDSVNYATESTYLTLASVLSPLYDDSSSNLFSGGRSSSKSSSLSYPNKNTPDSNSRRGSSFLLRMADRSSPARKTTQPYRHNNNNTGNSGGVLSNGGAVSWNILTQNPYNVVRGRHSINHRRLPISAVRSFLALVPVNEEDDDDDDDALEQEDDGGGGGVFDTTTSHDPYQFDISASSSPAAAGVRARSFTETGSSVGTTTMNNNQHRAKVAGRDEKASQVAEGTLRALRDLALEEALELNSALRFWSHRWERPLLSWLEAGPMVWASDTGYRHRMVGERVAQLQAVLARRCAAVGELQVHLLRAGGAQGVAQWGVLEQWATVAGVDGSIMDGPRSTSIPHIDSIDRDRPSVVRPENLMSSPALDASSRGGPVRGSLRRSSSHVGRGTSADLRKHHTAHILVRKGDGEGLYTDDPSFLAEWSVEAIALVRRHLYRAANGLVELPCKKNWSPNEDENGTALPLWVTEVKRNKSVSRSMEDEEGEEEFGKGLNENKTDTYLKVTDLNMMMAEVSELLNVMEDIMMVQRQRRLLRLRPPSWLRRNWYFVATAGPMAFWLICKGHILSTVKFTLRHVQSFVKERLTEPFMAIINEVWKGRESFSDKKARLEAKMALKEMIRNWLDETHPHRPESERIALAEALDMSLIEKKKAESMKTFLNLTTVIRLSFIEMQFMKIEMMNALAAMDDVMSSNDINMNVAAITPVLMLLYANMRMFRFFYYALLRLGRSREETYADFRSILTNIERLLVMRDSPPDIYGLRTSDPPSQPVLNPDDLGMLMLLIYELRTILMSECRRFTRDEIRGVSEDLAEIAGERGAVSVRQQLQILSRMGRNYSFLKVISTGHMFQYSTIRLSH